MMVVAMPLYVLYELSIWVAAFVQRRQKRDELMIQ